MFDFSFILVIKHNQRCVLLSVEHSPGTRRDSSIRRPPTRSGLQFTCPFLLISLRFILIKTNICDAFLVGNSHTRNRIPGIHPATGSSFCRTQAPRKKNRPAPPSDRQPCSVRLVGEADLHRGVGRQVQPPPQLRRRSRAVGQQQMGGLTEDLRRLGTGKTWRPGGRGRGGNGRGG